MMTFSAYRLVDELDPNSTELIWWDGKKIQTSSQRLLNELKYNTVIPVSDKDGKIPTWGDGEKFFKMLPLAYRSGYLYLVKTKVNTEGKEIK